MTVYIVKENYWSYDYENEQEQVHLDIIVVATDLDKALNRMDADIACRMKVDALYGSVRSKADYAKDYEVVVADTETCEIAVTSFNEKRY